MRDLNMTGNTSRWQNRANSRNPPSSSTMLIEAQSEPELASLVLDDEDKRSRSLTSLRRRHWSASSNRSSTTISTASHVKKNTEAYEKYGYRKSDACLTSNSNLHEIHSTIISHPKSISLKANSSLMNRDLGENSSQRVYKKYRENCRSNINLSTSVCSLVTAGSKQLRKSINGLLNATSTKLTQSDEHSSKENKIVKPLAVSPCTKQSGYAQRFVRFKKTLIKTKNTLFNRKNFLKSSDPQPINHSRSHLKRKSTSSSNISKLNHTSVGIPTHSRFDLEIDANQSSIDNVRTRFTKPQSSNNQKINKNNNTIAYNLNSTAVTTKYPNFDANSLSDLHSTKKRPRFY